jgi:hypothetical protein
MEELIVHGRLQHIVLVGSETPLERVGAESTDDRGERQQQRSQDAEAARGGRHGSVPQMRRFRSFMQFMAGADLCPIIKV